MGYQITTLKDLLTYIDNVIPEAEQFGYRDALAAALAASDHPRWGNDWSDWLQRNARQMLNNLIESDAEVV